LEEVTGHLAAFRWGSWYYDDKLRTWCPTPLGLRLRSFWDPELVAEVAELGWPVERGWEEYDRYTVFAGPVPRAKRAGGPKLKYDRKAQDTEMRRYVRENGRPTQAALVRHMEGWAAQRDETGGPSHSYFKQRVKSFLDTNSVNVQKVPRKSKHA
jgi:hypothetical protein